jgi:hypothetical protein
MRMQNYLLPSLLTAALIGGMPGVTALRASAQTADVPPYAVSTCRPVVPATVHHAKLPVCDLFPEPFLINRRLALIENGTVPCVEVDTMEATRCVFNAVPSYTRVRGPVSSGHWLEDREGRQYAVVGQPVTRDGSHASGAFIVGTVADAEGSVPCVGASGRDSAAAVAGTDLVSTCVVETGGSDTNVTGRPLRNWVTGFVGTSTLNHPDGARRVAFDPDRRLAWYTEEGAALNDMSGTERDPFNVYYYSSNACHLVMSNGVQVPAAKRPSTRSYPRPGVVLINTPILWMVANPYVNIANGSCLDPRLPTTPPPSAFFTVSYGRNTISVDASRSSGDIIRYTWDLEWTTELRDLETPASTAEFSSVVPNRTGGWITLTVVDRGGAKNSVRERVSFRQVPKIQ